MKALTLTFALLLICTGAALAQTPDGETPAEETVCDNETGAAYGLCSAYCEAMDCETDDPSASATACSRVQEKFQQITGRDLPCEVPPQVTCPCVAAFNTFAAVVNGQEPISSCSSSGFLYGPSFGNIYGRVFPQAPDDGFCGVGGVGTIYPIPLAEAQACLDLLLAAAANQGVPCP